MKNKASSGTLFRLLVRSYLLFTLTLLLIAGGIFCLWNVSLDRAYQSSDWDRLLRDPALTAGNYQDLNRYLRRGQDAFAIYNSSGRQIYASAQGFDPFYAAGELSCMPSYGEAAIIDVYDKVQGDGSVLHLLVKTTYTEETINSPDIMALDEHLQVVFGGLGDNRTSYTQREYQLLCSKELFRASFRLSDGQAATAVLRIPPVSDDAYFAAYQNAWKIWLLFLPLYFIVTALFIWQLRRKIARRCAALTTRWRPRQKTGPPGWATAAAPERSGASGRALTALPTVWRRARRSVSGWIRTGKSSSRISPTI